MLPLMSSYLIYHLFFPTSLQRIGSLKVQSGLNSFAEVKRQSQKQQKQFSLQSWNLGEPALKAHFVDRLDIVVLWHDWVILCHFLQATNRTCAEDVCCSARNQENENDKEKRKKGQGKRRRKKTFRKNSIASWCYLPPKTSFILGLAHLVATILLLERCAFPARLEQLVPPPERLCLRITLGCSKAMASASREYPTRGSQSRVGMVAGRGVSNGLSKAATV